MDLTPAFRERAAMGENLFFEIDVHPNAAAQDADCRCCASLLETKR